MSNHCFNCNVDLTTFVSADDEEKIKSVLQTCYNWRDLGDNGITLASQVIREVIRVLESCDCLQYRWEVSFQAYTPVLF